MYWLVLCMYLSPPNLFLHKILKSITLHPGKIGNLHSIMRDFVSASNCRPCVKKSYRAIFYHTLDIY